MGLQFGQRLAEVVLAGQAEAVNGALSVLTEKHLVEVRLEDFPLVVMQLQQQGHRRFHRLAAEGAFAGQEEVLHQLLGQGTTALAQPAGTDIHPHGPGNRLGRHAEMIEVLAILDGDQRIDQ